MRTDILVGDNNTEGITDVFIAEQEYPVLQASVVTGGTTYMELTLADIKTISADIEFHLQAVITPPLTIDDIDEIDAQILIHNLNEADGVTPTATMPIYIDGVQAKYIDIYELGNDMKFALFISEDLLYWDLESNVEGDFYMGSALDQNEYHILKCNKSNLVSAPLSGVGAVNYLNSNSMQGEFRDIVNKEFELDKLKINNMIIGSGGNVSDINIDSEEI